MKTVAIIQARMGSSRLPGKVLTPICGKPVLWHVVHRLKLCQEIDSIVIATTKNSTDDPIVTFCTEEDIQVIRGSEDNVLERFLLAARKYEADLIIRVTGDAPLIDAETIDMMVRALKKENADICRSDFEKYPVIHEGFTPVSRRALEALGKFGGNDPAVREHVTVKFQDYVPNLKEAFVCHNKRHVFKRARISIDTPADIQFMSTVYRLLNAKPGEANIADVVELLKAQPDLLAINQHVHQKDMNEQSHKLLVRCDGSDRVGMGHVMRCLSIAQILRDKYAVGLHFVMKQNEDEYLQPAIDLLERHHISPILIPHETDERDFLSGLMSKQAFDAALFDIRTDLDADFLKELEAQNCLTVCLDDPSDRRLASTLSIFPPVQQIAQMDWSGFNGELLSDWCWIALHPSFNNPFLQKSENSRPHLLISTGGADPHGVTQMAIESLRHLNMEFEPHIVLGPAFKAPQTVEAWAFDNDISLHIHHNVDDMSALMSTMDVALTTFGVSAYELAASGIPAVIIPLNEEHEIAARALVAAGAALATRSRTSVTVSEIASHVQALLTDTALRGRMSQAALNLGIAQGAANIALKIKTAISNKGTV